MTHWNSKARFAFRFAFVYFILYLLPFPLDGTPQLDAAAELYNAVWIKAVPWVAANVFGKEITEFPGGSSDTRFNYIQLLCYVVIAFIAALFWSIVDRKRPAYPRLYDWLRIYIRFALGLTMFGYGIIKVLPSQFPYPDLDRFIQPIGHTSPMGLLWTFMGASPAYCVFSGLAECIGGLLLFWRRTVTLGALIIAGVMTNVVMMNFCYDVPVKQYSTHLLLLSLFLLLPDVRRLADFLLLNRATIPKALGRPFTNRWLNRAAVAIKVVFLGFTLLYATTDAVEAANVFAIDAPRPALYGLYEIESFTRNGESVPPVLGQDKRWRRMVINRMGRLAVQLMDDSLERFLIKDNANEGKLELTPRWEPDKKAVLNYRKQGDDRLALEGDFFGDDLRIVLLRTPEPKFLLRSRGFHWVNEKPFNR